MEITLEKGVITIRPLGEGSSWVIRMEKNKPILFELPFGDAQVFQSCELSDLAHGMTYAAMLAESLDAAGIWKDAYRIQRTLDYMSTYPHHMYLPPVKLKVIE